MPGSPRNNLDSNSAPWGRWVDQNIDDINTALGRNGQDQLNNNKQLNSSINVIGQQIQALQDQQNLLAQQQSALSVAVTAIQNTTNYLNGLITVAKTGANLNSGPFPADSTFRTYDTGATVTLPVSTGRLLVGFGVGEASMSPGSSTSLLGDAVISLNGGGYTNMPYATVFVTAEQLGAGISRFAVLTVPPGSTATVTLGMRTWATSGTGTDQPSVQFTGPWITAQVIAAS